MARSMKRLQQSIFLTAVAAPMFLGRPSLAAEAKPVIVQGQTKPSEETKLAFPGPGLVLEVIVKEGDVVKKDQVLAKQDDRQDQAALDSMKLEADSTYKVDYSIADEAVKEVQFQRKMKMLSQHVASESEVEEARLAVTLAKTQIDLAKLEHEQKVLDAKKQQFKVDEMQMRSKVDGIVEKLNIHPGEMADPQNRDGAIVVVKNDPLWIEVHLPTFQSQQLQISQPLDVKYADEKDWRPAKIIYIDPQADAASDTQLVRLELANSDGRTSGLQMQVKLPEKIAAVAEGGDR